MSYLEEFRLLLEGHKFPAFLHLWEEYCLNDQVDGLELFELLKMIKDSPFAPAFGKVVETVVPLWERIKGEEVADHVLRMILDLQTTQSPLLSTLALDYLTSHYQSDRDFNEKLRIVGLRSKQSFQGAITNFELLTHMKKGAFVFHTGGWGVGEVMEMSLLQERVILEFEGINAKKDLTFEKAFKNLIYLPYDHFLARRFGNPDKLEKEGKEDPLFLLKLVLRDLGPKTAGELKDELCELVIPEEDWAKWWQLARAKAKKDTLIQTPENSKEPFILLQKAISHESLLKKEVQAAKDQDSLIQIVYQYFRDFPAATREPEAREIIHQKLSAALDAPGVNPELALSRKIQICFLLEDLFPVEFPEASRPLVTSLSSVDSILNLIDILAFKKRFLVLIRQVRDDWDDLFAHLLLNLNLNPLRDYVFKELLSANKPLLAKKVHELLHHMTLYPEPFFWYFQKIAQKEEGATHEKEVTQQFLEAFLILLHFIEHDEEHKELVKKMHNLLTAQRFLVVRELIAGGSVAFLKEFLLLASKCHTFAKAELRTLQSLAEVVHPGIGDKKEAEPQLEIIWTTQQGYQKIQDRIRELGTVEMIDNAKEIEAARAHGDLRENSEYKFALERRSRLQGELSQLSKQINLARILSKDDISPDEVGPGSIVDIEKSDGEKVSYTLLGPWDANPDENILSFQSKLAQSMMGLRVGESFDFQGKACTIKKIRSYLN